MNNLSIKKRLLLLSLSIMLIMLAILVVSGALFNVFEDALRNQATADHIVKLVQKARIAEKAYRQYYLDQYRHVVKENTNQAKQLLPLLGQDSKTGEQNQILGLISSYEETFSEVIRFHHGNVDLSQRIQDIMSQVQARTKEVIDAINLRQFNARTLQNRVLDQMESRLLSPLQDVNYLSIFLQLSHQRFLRTNDAEHLAEFYRFFHEYGPGLFGALKQGSAYLGNKFYQQSVAGIQSDLQTAIGLLEKSHELLSQEESNVSQLDQIGRHLETRADQMLQNAQAGSRRAKAIAFSLAAAMFVIGAALILGISFTLARSITKPLENLVKAANAISRGDLDTRIQIQQHNEFSRLGYAFNNMTENLSQLLLLLETENKERKAAEVELKKLSRRMIVNQEMERAAVARELHDELGQVLTALKIDAVWLKNHASFEGGNGWRRIDNMCDFIEKSIDDVRSLSLRLRPKVLDDMGLSVALRWLGSDFQFRTGIACRVLAHELAIGDDTVATTLYRVAQECLTNVARHAEATQVEVVLRITGSNGLLLAIEDNGSGLDTGRIKDQGALGVVGMMERAELIGARFEIFSGPGQGCKVSLEIENDDWEGPKS